MTEQPSTRADRPTILPWPPILLAALGGGAWLLGINQPIPWPGVDDGPARIIGLGLGAAGIALLVWALAAFRRHNTTVMPNQAASTLITDGPYRRFRNPIYLAEILIFFGLAEVTKNIWFVAAGIAFAVLVTQLAIIPEENHLEATFGDAYRNYKSNTRRWI